MPRSTAATPSQLRIGTLVLMLLAVLVVMLNMPLHVQAVPQLSNGANNEPALPPTDKTPTPTSPVAAPAPALAPPPRVTTTTTTSSAALPTTTAATTTATTTMPTTVAPTTPATTTTTTTTTNRAAVPTNAAPPPPAAAPGGRPLNNGADPRELALVSSADQTLAAPHPLSLSSAGVLAVSGALAWLSMSL